MMLCHVTPKPEALTGSLKYQIDQTNLRLVVSDYPRGLEVETTCDLITLAKLYGLEKIWLWAFLEDVPEFLKVGFQFEGTIDDNRRDKPTASLAYYVQSERRLSKNLQSEKEILQQITTRKVEPLSPLRKGMTLRLLDIGDSFAVSCLLRDVFTSYPTQVEDTGYIQKLMTNGCIFAGAFYDQKLVSVAAAYPEQKWLRCEITDCATRPEYRGHSLTERLIKMLEPVIDKKGAYTLYTLARATSYGINRVFYRLGYRFQGRLINNCHIAGDFEDMNLWVRYR